MVPRQIDLRLVLDVAGHRAHEACERLLGLLNGGDTPGQVDKVIVDWSEPADAITGFTER